MADPTSGGRQDSLLASTSYSLCYATSRVQLQNCSSPSLLEAAEYERAEQQLVLVGLWRRAYSPRIAYVGVSPEWVVGRARSPSSSSWRLETDGGEEPGLSPQGLTLFYFLMSTGPRFPALVVFSLTRDLICLLSRSPRLVAIFLVSFQPYFSLLSSRSLINNLSFLSFLPSFTSSYRTVLTFLSPLSRSVLSSPPLSFLISVISIF